MAKIKNKETIMKIVTDPIFISSVVFVVATIVVIRLTIIKVKSAYDAMFIRDILVEAHGMLFDIFIIGTLIFALHKLVERRLEKRHNIQRWQEEIDDFRGWDEKEATFKIVGNIRRLNRNGITKIDLYGCFLKQAFLMGTDLRGAALDRANLRGADLGGADLRGADLGGTDLRGAALDRANLYGVILRGANLKEAILVRANLLEADLRRTNLGKANLVEADLCGSNLYGADLRGADLEGADLMRAKQLTIEQLSKVRILYKAKLDPELEKQIKEKYPHLLKKPELPEFPKLKEEEKKDEDI